MATGILRITGLITGLIEGEETIGPFELQTLTPVGQRISPLVLAVGNNTIAVPSQAIAMILIPPPNNTQTLTLKGGAGDTGIRIHKTLPTPIALDSGFNPTLVITLGAGSTVTCSVIFV